MQVLRVCRATATAILACSLLVCLGLTTAAAPTGTAAALARSDARGNSATDKPVAAGREKTLIISEVPISTHTVKNPQCQLHKRGQSKSCGLKEMDAKKGNGVVFWNPEACNRLHCQCQATKEVLREKTSFANNKTVTEYTRFRVFECL